jgi:hypothetical protein
LIKSGGIPDAITGIRSAGYVFCLIGRTVGQLPDALLIIPVYFSVNSILFIVFRNLCAIVLLLLLQTGIAILTNLWKWTKE